MIVLNFVRCSRTLFCLLSGCGTLALLAAGCGTATKPCAIQGTVHLKGAPASGVYVQLVDASQQAAGAGRTDSSGAFQLTVSNAGDYAVTCFLPKVTKTREDYIEGEDLLQGRYRDPSKPAAMVSIKVGENVIPVIQLQ